METNFLSGRDGHTWEENQSVLQWTIFVGNGLSPLEVCVTSSRRQPSDKQLTEILERRKAGRSNPVFIVVLNTEEHIVSGCSYRDGHPVAIHELNRDGAERICRTLLNKATSEDARELLQLLLKDFEEKQAANSRQSQASHDVAYSNPVKQVEYLWKGGESDKYIKEFLGEKHDDEAVAEIMGAALLEDAVGSAQWEFNKQDEFRTPDGKIVTGWELGSVVWQTSEIAEKTPRGFRVQGDLFESVGHDIEETDPDNNKQGS